MTKQTPEDFAATFAGRFQRSAFRLELLDRYVAANEQEPYRRFIAGLPQDPAWREPWAQFVRLALRDGKRMSRVHVVDEPLSDYLQFELTCGYPANVTAGEDIRILARREWPMPSMPAYDFWLFDDHEVAIMSYDEAGNWFGADMATDSRTIMHCRHIRDLAMTHSIPLTTYLGTLGLKEAV